jgi:hypothetical protein
MLQWRLWKRSGCRHRLHHDGVPVDPRDVLAGLGWRAASGPLRLTGGWDTLLWRFWTGDGADHVLRVFHLPRAQDIAHRERLALDACARAGVPAPRVEATGEYRGLPLTVQSWCPGAPLLTLVERRPWTLLAWGASSAAPNAGTSLSRRRAPPPRRAGSVPREGGACGVRRGGGSRSPCDKRASASDYTRSTSSSMRGERRQ